MELTEIVQSYLEKKAKYRFFDLNSWVHVQEEQFYPVRTVEEVERELIGHRIADALITNAKCLRYNPGVGNEELLGLIRNLPSYYGAIVWSPELGRSKAETADYLDRMIANRIAIVRLFPKKLNYSLNKWQVGDLLSAMESRGLPLLLWHVETNWDTIHNLCEQFPRLPVIVEGNDQKLLYHNRSFVPLLERHTNLYIETHSLIQHESLEYIVNERGVNRLLFGTYFPNNDPNSSMMMVTDANIPEEAKLAIAGDHLRRLIANIRN